MRIFVAGATGWIGSRLVPRLLAAEHDVVVLARSADRVAARPWGDRVEVVVGDATDSRPVTQAMFGVDVAIHLVHAMEAAVDDFRKEERRTARTIAGAAALAGVGHIVYLGGLVPDDDEELSPHLASRVATGRILADAGPPTTEVRASVVLGAGSASYELVRFVAQTPFPLIVHPNWATGMCQPIGIADLLDILEAVVNDGPRGQHRIIEVGGPEVGHYHDLVDVMREVRGGVPTVSAPVPTMVSPVMTGQLLATLTPIDPGTVAPLVTSLAHDSVVTGGDHEAVIAPTTVVEAMRASIAGEGEYGPMSGDPDWVGATLDLSLLAQVVQRLPRLPARLVPGLQRDHLLSTAVDVVTSLRGA
jgi:uncharacterized protein YbjT (DUF2867 family)